MKLVNFENDAGLNELRSMANAKLVKWNSESTRDPLLNQLLENGEIEASFEDIEVDWDGTLQYKGKKVLVYIRDQYINYRYRSGKSSYKFHFMKCRTLQTSKVNKSFSGRYVLHHHGLFKVNLIDRNNNNHTLSKEEKLEPCINCLKQFNYMNYKNRTHDQKEIYKNFDKDLFLKSYDTDVYDTKYSVDSLAINIYPDNRTSISSKVRRGVMYICQKCGKDCSRMKMDLHVHHIDHNKGNCNRSNLIALCRACHSLEHNHMT